VTAQQEVAARKVLPSAAAAVPIIVPRD